MNRIILLSTLLLMLSSAGSVPGAANSYIGIYADYSRSSWCVGDGGGTVDVWIWILTDDGGMSWFGYNFDAPSAYTRLSGEFHPDLIPEIVEPGDTSPHFDYGGVLSSCKGNSWVWTYHLTYSVPAGEPGIFQVTSHPVLGTSRLVDCDSQAINLTKLTNLYVGYSPESPECSGMASEACSWGAIKEMYGD